MAASSSPTYHDLLSAYLKDHLTAASAGVELFRRCARSHSSSAARARLAVLAGQVAEDRDALVEIMRRLDVPVQPHRFAVGWVTEKAGRLKPNGSLWRRTRLTDLVELESMSVGVTAKLSAWQNLEVTARSDERPVSTPPWSSRSERASSSRSSRRSGERRRERLRRQHLTGHAEQSAYRRAVSP
ncbi:MAG: hypothetical protein ACR2LE_08130 [Nocardioidaceae bacterium]